jgi:hypothetical protein
VTVIYETAKTRARGAPPSLSLPRKGGGNANTSTSGMARTVARNTRAHP